MKALLILALCVFTASAAHVFLTAPAKKVSADPSGLIFETVQSVVLGLNNSQTSSTVAAAITPNNSQVFVTFNTNTTVLNNMSQPYTLNLTVNYGYPWSDSNKQDSVVVVLNLNATWLAAVNSTQNLTFPAGVAWANVSVTKNNNFTTFGNVSLLLNVGNETDAVFNVFITSLNFSKSWQSSAQPQLIAPWSVCQVGAYLNGTLNTTGVDFSLDLTALTGFVNLNQSIAKISWTNASTDAQAVNVTFNTSYTYPGAVGVNSTMPNVTQFLAVNFTGVNSSTSWPASTDNVTAFVSFIVTNGSLVQNITLGISRNLSIVTPGPNVTFYTLQNLTLSKVQIPQTLDLTKKRLNSTKTTVSAVISYNSKSAPETLTSTDNTVFGVLLPSQTSNGAISVTGTRSSNVSLWINFVVNETYQNGNISTFYSMPFNLSGFVGQIGDFTSNTAGIFSIPMSFPFNLTASAGGETDWFNVSFTTKNTTTPEAYFSGWKFNLLNLTLNQILVQGENAQVILEALTPVMLGTGAAATVNALPLFTQNCNPATNTTVACVLAPPTKDPVQVVLQNVTTTTGGPQNLTLNATGLNVTYKFSNVLQLLPKVLLSWNVSDVFSNTSVQCKTDTTTGDPYLQSTEVCGQWAYNISVDPKNVNLTVLQISNVTFTFNSYQDYSNRGNLTQTMLQTQGISVQNQTQQNKSLLLQSSDTQISLSLPGTSFQVSNQTDKVGVDNLNLTIVYNISQTYSFNLISAKAGSTNVSNTTVSQLEAYEIDQLQQAMNDSMNTIPSNNNTAFNTLIFTNIQPWTQFSNSKQGYGAYYTQVNLTYGATGFVELTAPSNGLSGGAIAGIVIGCIAFIAILGVVIYCVTKKKDQDFYTKQNA